MVFDMRGLFFVATWKGCSDYMSWLLDVHTNGVTRVCEAPLLDYIWNSLQKSVLGDRVEKSHQIVVDATQCDFSWRCLQKSVKFLPYLWSGQLSPQFAAIVAATSNLLLWTLLLAVCPEMTENMKSMYGL